MVVIIEGIDRVGKTTLANKIKEKLGFDVVKQDRLDSAFILNQRFTNYGRAIGMVEMWNLDCFKGNIVMDRFHWTEYVYSLLDRLGDRVFLEKYLADIEDLMLQQKDKYLVIQVMPVDINMCCREHGKDLKQHQKEFDGIYEKSKLNKYRCTYFSYDMAIKEIERRMKNGQTE